MSQEIFDAIRANDQQAVAGLLARNPQLARARNGAGVSALMQARYEFKFEILELIRQAAGEVDVFEAAALGDVARLRELLAGDPGLATTYSNDGFTALQFACFFGQPQAVKELTSGGSDVNAVAKNTMRVAAINTAVASHNAEIVRTVLRAGARPDHQQQAGYTALHEAAAHNDVDIAKALLDAGADRNIRSDDGKTAADMARQKGHAEVLALLENEKQAAKA